MSENRIPENLVICIDTSRSMFKKDFSPNRLSCCISAIKKLIKERFNLDSLSAFAIIKYADLIVMIVRYNVTKKKLFRLVLSELANKNINEVYIVLNDNKLVSEQMGYGYYNKK